MIGQRHRLGVVAWFVPALFAAVALLGSPSAMAQRVQELGPNELAAFLAKHPKVVVQLTSPSKKCGFCVGADRLFDQATAKAPADWAFARVQWEPWHKIPTFEDLDLGLFGVPTHMVFVTSRHGGQFERTLLAPSAFAQILGEVDKGTLRPGGYWRAEHLPGYQASPEPAAKPKIARAAVQAKGGDDINPTMWRELVQGLLMDMCSQLYPQDRELHQAGLQQWRKKHANALERAARDMLDEQPSSGPKPNTSEMEMQAMQAWLLQRHGVVSGHRDPAPSRQQCTAIAETLNER